MCARLIRLLKENYGRKLAIHSATSGENPNFFLDDEDFIDEFMEQRWIMDASADDNIQNIHKNHEMGNPLDPRASELIRALVQAEQFMRSSVNSLELLRSIEPDTRIIARPSHPALDWLRHALDMAMRIQQLFIENENLRNSIMKPGLRPPPALAKFLELIFLVLSTFHLWKGRNDNHWIWPDIKNSDYNQDWKSHFPYVDLVRELVEIQELLDKQNSARDRLRNANFATSCNLVNEAFAISSKVLAIRIDLGYARGTSSCIINNTNNSEKKSIFNIDKFLSHLSIFLAVTNKFYSSSRLAYILKIEYGIDKGYHAHILILLNGHKHQQDISIAQKLGKSWSKDITEGLGVYWNCNANRIRYSKDAIGMIYRKDEQKREYLEKYVLTYLVKHDIPLEMLRERKFRKFRASHRKLK